MVGRERAGFDPRCFLVRANIDSPVHAGVILAHHRTRPAQLPGPPLTVHIDWRDPPGGRVSSRTAVSTAIAGAIAILLGGSMAAFAQATVDTENRYSNVGVIMVWRVDSAGRPVELRGFASATLIRDRVMVTAGHFTAPAKALGSIPPSLRMFASFST